MVITRLTPSLVTSGWRPEGAVSVGGKLLRPYVSRGEDTYVCRRLRLKTQGPELLFNPVLDKYIADVSIDKGRLR